MTFVLRKRGVKILNSVFSKLVQLPTWDGGRPDRGRGHHRNRASRRLVGGALRAAQQQQGRWCLVPLVNR